MRKEFLDYGIRYTRGNFLNIVQVKQSEGERNFKFELFNNRVRARRPVATLTTNADTVIRDGILKRSFEATLEIRPDVPFSQDELNNLPIDIATLMFQELGGNPLKEEFIIKIISPSRSAENEDNVISESWISGKTDLNHYTIISRDPLVMSSGY